MKGISFSKEKPQKIYGFMVIGLLIGIYTIGSLPLAPVIGSWVFHYALKPFLWLVLALIIWQLPKPEDQGEQKLLGMVNWWALSIACILIIFSILAGFIHGFGRSPYSHSVVEMLINIIYAGSSIVGMELARSYLVHSLTKKENQLLFVGIALFMTVVGISLNRFLSIESIEQAVQFGAQYFVPELTKNLLLTFMAYIGGPLPGMIYMGVTEAFHWLSPILPDLEWITQAFIGTLVPLFAYLFLENMYAKVTGQIKEGERKEGLLGWMITSLVSILIIWFVLGVFPIYPSVIATGSMRPMIHPGDVVLVDKALRMEDIESLQKGDVILFQRGNILISHRIVEILEEDGVPKFRTKGDSNSVEDSELVAPENIKGRVVKVVPKIGWPSLWLRSRKGTAISEVEF